MATRSETGRENWPIAVFDWGTTNLRVHVVSQDGAIVASQSEPEGVRRQDRKHIPGIFRSKMQPMIDTYGCRRAVLIGMVGSSFGWMDTAMQGGPVDAQALSDALVRVPTDLVETHIVPGVLSVSSVGLPDMMRGEETQAIGAMTLLSLETRRFCLPGTHSKWVQCRNGRIETVSTAMTGESFDFLANQSVLSTNVGPDTDALDFGDFDLGVETARTGLGALQLAFSTRARTFSGRAPSARNNRGYLSGLLIGSEIAALADDGEAVTLVGDLELCRMYQRAATILGVVTDIVDGDEAAAAGAALLVGLRIRSDP